MITSLDSFTQLFLPALEQEIKAVLASDDPDHRLYYGMMHYHLGWLDSHLNPVAGRGGKRIRPLICLLVCDAAGGDWQQALPAAAAIELLHNFSLIHDDIEDHSRTRRGRDTVWSVWGVPQAINTGDSMFASAFDALARLTLREVPDRATVSGLRAFIQACISLTKGQQLDIWFETEVTVTVEQYLQMIAGKTAALLCASAEIGAIVAEATGEKQEHYAQFGRHIGLAFQVYDDILGIWGDEASTGKSTASDILTRKKTLPVLYGLAHSPALVDLYAQPEIDLERAVALLDQIGARDYAHSVARRYSEAAVAHLEAAAPTGAAGEALRALAAQLIQRRR
jgi:geranylgeranyl diphosphate synthase type I